LAALYKAVCGGAVQRMNVWLVVVGYTQLVCRCRFILAVAPYN